jgi:hypothetical protein
MWELEMVNKESGKQLWWHHLQTNRETYPITFDTCERKKSILWCILMYTHPYTWPNHLPFIAWEACQVQLNWINYSNWPRKISKEYLLYYFYLHFLLSFDTKNSGKWYNKRNKRQELIIDWFTKRQKKKCINKSKEIFREKGIKKRYEETMIKTDIIRQDFYWENKKKKL